MKTIIISILLMGAPAFAAAAFDLGPGVVEISHNRPDLSVEKLWLHTACFNQDGSWAEEDCSALEIDAKQSDIFVEFLALNKGENQNDFVLYTEPKDRYSILSFCNVDELPGALATQARFAHRRVKSWGEFAVQFSQPIKLVLKPQP